MRMSLYKSFLGPVALLFLAATAWAGPMAATAVYVRGDVRVVSEGKAAQKVELDHSFMEGDFITTSADGIVEIRLDNGNLIRIDNSSEFVIQTLNRDEETQSTFSIFNLIVGRVKSSVAKLITTDSRFEYVTKAAIVGVAGTPPWVLEFDGEKASVDLLGRPGEKGSVYVKGFDPARTTVFLLSNMRTIVNAFDPPMKPFAIPMERRRMLDRIIPFSFQQKGAGKEDEGKDAQAPAQPAPEEKKKEDKPGPPSIAESLVLDNVSNSISMPVKPKGGSVDNVSSASRMSSGEQGTVGEVGGDQKPPSTAQFQIQVNF